MLAWLKSLFIPAPVLNPSEPFSGPRSRKYDLHIMSPGETRRFANKNVRAAAYYLNKSAPEQFRFTTRVEDGEILVKRIH